jgi:hypothetical protein
LTTTNESTIVTLAETIDSENEETHTEDTLILGEEFSLIDSIAISTDNRILDLAEDLEEELSDIA